MWHQIATRVELRQVAPDAMLRNEAWPNWVPLHQHARPSPAPMNRELQGLIPSRYDAVVYAGWALFFAGLLLFLSESMLGVVLMIVAIVAEALALVFEIYHRGISVTSSVGNIIAGIGIIVQLLLTLMVVMVVL